MYQDVLSRRVRFPIKGEYCSQQLTSIVHMNTTPHCNHVYAAAACHPCLRCTSCTSCMPPMIGCIKYAVSPCPLGCQTKCIGVETLKVIGKLGDLQTSHFKQMRCRTSPTRRPRTTAAQTIEGPRLRHREEPPSFKKSRLGQIIN